MGAKIMTDPRNGIATAETIGPENGSKKPERSFAGRVSAYNTRLHAYNTFAEFLFTKA